MMDAIIVTLAARMNVQYVFLGSAKLVFQDILQLIINVYQFVEMEYQLEMKKMIQEFVIFMDKNISLVNINVQMVVIIVFMVNAQNAKIIRDII